MPKPPSSQVAKRKPLSIQKPHKVQNENMEAADPELAARQFQLELCWCIQQLERSFNEKKNNEKQLQESWKVLTVLKNNNQPVIRKRQLMRTHFGDYRAKMAVEEKKLIKMTSKMKILDSPVQAKGKFLRKSLFSTTGDNNFRFNFDLNPDKIDNNVNVVNNNCDNKILEKNIEVSEKKCEKTAPIEENTNDFKFTFSNSQFKFNFINQND